MLDTQTKEIVKSTIPALKQYGEDITKVFYRELFSRYPQVQGMFDMEKQKNGKQPKALAMAILNAANNIDNLEKSRAFVENIGNLVCPAEFRIGESLRITILSIPEGDDKVEKYPLMFTETDCLVLNKCDMLPYFDFNLERVQSNYETVNPNAALFQVSSRTRDGIQNLADFIAKHIMRAAL